MQIRWVFTREEGLGQSWYGAWRMKKICCFRWAAKS